MLRVLVRHLTLASLGAAALLPCLGWAQGGGSLQLEVVSRWQGTPVTTGWPMERPEAGRRVERLDLLLSGLSLQREDGSWIESQDWQGFVSLGKKAVVPVADGLPAGRYTAVRFEVGLPTALNAADPAQWAVGHPLHPDTCGLHWGWLGGYVFLALEGRWKKPDGSLGGFSFHLATDERLARVEVPVSFQGGGPVTLRLGLDAATLLAGIDLVRDGDVSHSRPGDDLAKRLQTNVSQAFSVVAVQHDQFQPAAEVAEQAATPAGTQPVKLDITKRFPQVALPLDNPLTKEGIALGERLFHDTRLSVNNSQSCASCHDRALAFSDAKRVSSGAQGQVGKRQSMPLFNLAWSQAFFWDGRAATLRQQVLMPIADPHEMNEQLPRVIEKLAGEEAAFEQAFGSGEVTEERLAKALEQYLLSLISQDSRFDRAARKVDTLSEQEKRGLQLFVTEHDPKRGLFGADCFHCHGGTLFTDHQFKNNGLDLAADDLGQMLVTGKAADRGKFKTPSLRNIAATAPYMHDGRFATLEEVVEHYTGPMSRSDTLDPNLAKHPETGLQLSAEDKQALVAFLKTLTDEAFIGQTSTTSSVAQQP
jgi:cytochrome c peroxidase